MFVEISFGLLITIIFLISWYSWYQGKYVYDIFNRYYYFDNNATTPLHPEGRIAMNEAMYLGNASSMYADQARQIMTETEAFVRDWIKSPNYNVIFTSGASESNNLFLRSLFETTPSGHIVSSTIEHKTSLECLAGHPHTLVEPTATGVIMPMSVVQALTPDTIAVSIMHCNNETGSINPIAEIAAAVKKYNPKILFHTDAVQTFGKMPIAAAEWQIDAISVAGHKMYAPLGVGLLILSPAATTAMRAQISGSQNNHLRGGTENVPAIAGFLASAKITLKDRCSKNKHLMTMKRAIMQGLAKEFKVGKFEKYRDLADNVIPPHLTGPEIVFLGDIAGCPNTLLISFVKPSLEKHFCNVLMKNSLFKKGFVVSIGSACNTASSEPSHVLKALRAPYIIRCGVIRISLGDQNRMSECKKLVSALAKCFREQL